MGWELRTIHISTRVSRHNSPRDAEHDRLWDLFCDRIEAIATDPEFAPISPMVY